MPKVSFYLRNEDLTKWKAIEKKTQWAHDQLNPAKVKVEIYGVDVNSPKGRQMLRDYRTEQTMVIGRREYDTFPTREVEVVDAKDYNLCKHNAVLSMCKRGCK